MSEILVEDGSTYPNSIVVPEDGDARNAASVVTPFQTLANRTRYLLDKLGAWIAGGSLEPSGDVSMVMGGNALNVVGGPLNLVGATFVPNGGVRGWLFTTGQTGMANKKVRLINSGSGDISVDPALYDTVIVGSGITGATTIELVPPTVAGAHMRIVSESPTYFASFKAQGGSTFGTNLKYSSGLFWGADLVFDGSAWRLIGVTPFNP